MALGQKLQLGLGALQPTLAKDAAGADGNLGLDDVIAAAERVFLRVDQHHDPLALIVMHQEEPEHRHKGSNQQHRQSDQPPAEPRQEDNEEAGGSHQNGGAKVRLGGNQQGRQQHHDEGYHHVAEFGGQRVTAEPGGDHDGHGELHHLGGLELHKAQVEPALGPLADMAEHVHRDEQQHYPDKQRHRPAGIEGGRQLSHADHQGEGESAAHQLAHDGVHILAGGGVEHHHGEGDDGQQPQQQGQVDVQLVPDTLLAG